MKVLLVTVAYPPEVRSASDLMHDLAVELRDRGHQVTVVTKYPDDNLDQESLLCRFREKEVESDITVLRVKTLAWQKVNYVRRAVSELLMPVQFLFALRKWRIRPSALVVYSPPLPLSLVGNWLKRRGVRFILNAQDIFPQNAIDLGVLTNPLHIRFFRYVESIAYRNADVVTVHSKGNLELLAKQKPELKAKLRILHNWIDVDLHKTRKVQVDFRTKWNIRHQYVAVFAGIMGPSQGLELILRVAEGMKECQQLLFLLVGDGKEKAKLQLLAKEKGLKNVRFEGFISREAYSDLLGICNIGLVCLSSKNVTPVVPGKILGYMAAGLPVAAFLQPASGGHDIIRDARCGVSADSADSQECVRVMQRLMDQRASFPNLGAAGKRYASEHFSKSVCVSQLESMLQEAKA